MLAFAIIVLLSYLLGSIPAAVWVGKITQGIDLREHGSGNAGATNTFRVLGWKAGTIVSLIDFGKGLIATWYLIQLSDQFGGVPGFLSGENVVYFKVIVGIAAVIGHTFPVFAQFRGGKGMLTSGGMLVGIEPISTSITLATYVLVLLISRYSSLASIVSASLFPVYVALVKFGLGKEINTFYLLFAIVLAVFLVSKHKANIQRLLAGTESKIGSKKDKEEKGEA